MSGQGSPWIYSLWNIHQTIVLVILPSSGPAQVQDLIAFHLTRGFWYAVLAADLWSFPHTDTGHLQKQTPSAQVSTSRLFVYTFVLGSYGVP